MTIVDPSTILSMVREFYSNLDAETNKSMVRRIEVRFNEEDIRSLFNLTWLRHVNYEKKLVRADHLTMSNYMCLNDTQWKND